MIYQYTVEPLNLIGTKFSVWNRQVFGLVKLTKISYIGTVCIVRFIQDSGLFRSLV